MTANTAGAATRPTPALHREGERQRGAPNRKHRSPTLSTLELRRLVAAMIG